MRRVSTPESFYVPTGPLRFRSTAHTTGPWSPDAQHGGPPSALLAHVAEECRPRRDTVVARVTVEILGPVPVGELQAEAEVTRPGRSVELVEAALSAGGRRVAQARVWRVLATGGEAAPPPDLAPPPRPAATTDLAAVGWAGSTWGEGYLGAVEWRFARGAFGKPGPAVAWTRLRVGLLPDTEPTPLTRVLAVADSGNGISSTLDMRRWHFINPELTVHLHRAAQGEWVCLDAATTISPGGAGLAASLLSDDAGPVGRGAQALLVAPRPGA
jgi:hypothetical protein